MVSGESSNSLVEMLSMNPSDQQLMHLSNKINSGLLRDHSMISVKDICECHPKRLQGVWYGHKMYCLSRRKHKYPKGHRLNRSMEEGRWDNKSRKEIKDENEKIIGYRRQFTFLEGRFKSSGKKRRTFHREKKGPTSWIMHEYESENCTRDSFVLCVIYENGGNSPTSSSTSILANTGIPCTIKEVGESSNSQNDIMRSSTLPNQTNSPSVNMNPFQTQSSGSNLQHHPLTDRSKFEEAHQSAWEDLEWADIYKMTCKKTSEGI